MACCDDRERQILESRMFSDEKKTLQELADGFGISKIKIKQIEKEAGDRVIDRLRTRFRGSFNRS
jgi:DNA-directed RNA polymerase sigma subunit (sigma70/sigma32)